MKGLTFSTYFIKNKSSFFFIFLLCVCFTHCSDRVKEETIIDESHLKESVEQIIEIDSVWAGHRVRFCLYTNNDRQYISYYNANRYDSGSKKY